MCQNHKQEDTKCSESRCGIKVQNQYIYDSHLEFPIRGLLLTLLLSGTSFSPDDRVSKNLTGLIPHVLESMDTQCQRALRMINSRGTNVDKYLYLSSLKANNIDLFYRLLIDHVAQMMPLVYTPTIGDVCLQYSTLYTRPEALYISIKQRKSIATILRNWPYPDPSICVVTDGSRILGLGDLGVNGVGISVCIASIGNFDSAHSLRRLASWRSTPLLQEFTPKRRSQLSLTAVLRMKTTSAILSTLAFDKSEFHQKLLWSSWMSSWLP